MLINYSIGFFFVISDNTDNDAAFDEDLHISEDSPPISSNEMTESVCTYKTEIIKSPVRKPMSAITAFGSKPKFLKLFDSCTIKEGGVLFLSCQVAGEPKPELEW